MPWRGLSEIASNSDQDAQKLSNLRKSKLLAAHCYYVLLLMRDWLLWQPGHKPAVGRVVDFAPYRTWSSKAEKPDTWDAN